MLTNRQTSKFIIFLSNISISRPGVATIMCTPLNNEIKVKIYYYYLLVIKTIINYSYVFKNYLLIISSDSKTGIPPIAKHDLSVG